jgi:hypothetical protein
LAGAAEPAELLELLDDDPLADVDEVAVPLSLLWAPSDELLLDVAAVALLVEDRESVR